MHSNFSFLDIADRRLCAIGAAAERYFREDPSTAIFKLRQFIELLAKTIAARTALYLGERESLEETLRRLSFERTLPRQVADVFHAMRRLGNAAVHENKGTHEQALTSLKLARELGVWYVRTYAGKPAFKPGPFLPPPEPVDATAGLREEIAALQAKAAASADAALAASERAEAEARARESAEERARREAEERVVWEQLAQDSEASRQAIGARLAELQKAAEAAPAAETGALAMAAEAAAEKIDLDEAETRALIDGQLRARGWEADSRTMRHADGIRPAKGRAMAIAEWPTASGPADYALFIDLTLVAVVEAKRKRKNVSAAIDQAERYSKGFGTTPDVAVAGGPWGEHKVPFVFAANGRAYLKQIETESGIWFRDTRRAANHRRALVDWFTPAGLSGLIEVDEDRAALALDKQSFQFGFPLRHYQRSAIEAAETALADGRRAMLIAMATGTGKTKLAIAMLYRLLSAKRFRRICFVVDRSALGHQTAGEFSTTKVVSGKTFADIFGLKGLGDVTPDSETKVHVCTIQGLVKRVLFAAPDEVPPVDQYDLMVIDECHRGYLLDREMSDTELSFRGQDDYVSKYRRVLEYFDAVKIGLTATPALHTGEIFGTPIFRYSYREAVIDGFLVDHEPPIRIETMLGRSGIGFAEGEQVDFFATDTGEIKPETLPDEVRFEINEFNKKVVTRSFNQVVAETLARHIDPALPGKTLIFAATKGHADIVVDELKKAFAATYGAIDDDAVQRITGDTDNVQARIRSFRNDASPKIAVTVDLLTTGIDVPAICNLVFLRRVNSRILYEQMIGRATRLCAEIGKEYFRIFDAVDIYPHLKDLTDMKPVAVDPHIGFEQLVQELLDAKDERQRAVIRDQLAVKLRRRLKSLPQAARAQFEAVAGEPPEATLSRLLSQTPQATAAWLATRSALGAVLDRRSDEGPPTLLPISTHADEVIAVTRGYGAGQRPQDFLDSFAAFVRDNVNTLAALKLVVQRPRELTRADLKELRLALDTRGFSDASVRRAWADAKNEDIAASIIGFVRQAALGDALVPYADRVKAAMAAIGRSRAWTQPQRNWLKRIGEQVEKELVVDREALDREPFATDGGFNRLNKVFGGELESVLAGINEELWRKSA